PPSVAGEMLVIERRFDRPRRDGHKHFSASTSQRPRAKHRNVSRSAAHPRARDDKRRNRMITRLILFARPRYNSRDNEPAGRSMMSQSKRLFMTRRGVLTSAIAGASTAALGATPALAQARKTFVLVHGAWHGGWCWRRVADLIEKKGHKVYTPTLTGVGERS